MAGNLTRAEAAARSRVLRVAAYVVELDLTTGPDRFRSTSCVRFRAEPGGELFCDLAADTVHEARLNGVRLDPAAWDPVAGRLRLTGVAEHNEVAVVADFPYSRTGQGLHRFVDPADGEVYLWTQLAPADASQLMVCFDQPDLKATFELTVTAPAGWEVVSNAPLSTCDSTDDGDGTDGVRRWHFATTPPLPTYLYAVVAGPYRGVAATYDAADGRRVDLRVLTRASLVEHLDADEILDTTRRGFAFYEGVFELPYPFEKYDQVFVPEMTSFGAMENAGCVTIRDEYVFRSKVTDAEYERRGMTVLHELAHMWFGNLVTMRWWDDTWLNESFATYAAALAQASATRWTDAWATFADRTKALAYRQDQLPSTHPVSADIVDLRAMEVNFDGITYHKGASVLRQLVATVGEKAFLAGIRTYFRRHAWGSATLADLLAALSEESGHELSHWSARWLETTGPNLLRPEWTSTVDGALATFAVLQSAPPGHPTLRPHHIAIGLYDRTATGIRRRHRVELDVDGERTEVPELVGVPVADLVLVNDDDLTYAKLRLDPLSLSTMLDGIAEFADPLAQAVCWTLAWDMTRDAELAARHYVALVLGGVGSVASASIVATLLQQAGTAAEHYTAPAWRGDGLPALADSLLALVDAAAPGSETQLSYLRAFAALARTDAQLDTLVALLDGSATRPGLVVDTELRWVLLRRLVATGRVGGDAIDAEQAADATAGGERSAAAARAARPTDAAKAEAWRAATGGELSTSMLRATLEGFHDTLDPSLLAPYTPAYFAVLSERVGSWASERTQAFARFAYPSTDEAALAATDAYLDRADPPDWLRRLVVELRDELVRTLRAQAFDAQPDNAHSDNAHPDNAQPHDAQPDGARPVHSARSGGAR